MSSGLDTLIPTGGVGVSLVAVIFYLLNANRVDRKDYQESVDRAERRADEEAARAQAAQTRLDDALNGRRTAEDTSAETNRVVADLRAQVVTLSRQLDSQRRDHP